MTIWKNMIKINLYMPQELLDRLDEAAKQRFISRSDYIRQAVIASLKPSKPKFRGSELEKEDRSTWWDIDDS